MPYAVVNSTRWGCSSSKPWGVYRVTVNWQEGDTPGDRLGCHATEAEALAQQRALYANEPKPRNKSMESLTETRQFDLGRVDVREKNGVLTFKGHAAVFNVPAVIGDFQEVVRPGAFTRALSESQDVVFTLDHDPAKLLARTSSGTLSLREDRKGLAVEATLPDTTYARDAAELVSRGDLNGMSFQFKPVRQEWGFDGSMRQRSLEDVDLFDVSLVTHPAYANTDVDVELREWMDALLEVRAGAEISQKNRDKIQHMIDIMQSILDGADMPVLNPRSLRLDLLEKYGS